MQCHNVAVRAHKNTYNICAAAQPHSFQWLPKGSHSMLNLTLRYYHWVKSLMVIISLN